MRTNVPSRVNHVHWHRVVLDECQEIRAPTAWVAELCHQIPSTHRCGASCARGAPSCACV